VKHEQARQLDAVAVRQLHVEHADRERTAERGGGSATRDVSRSHPPRTKAAHECSRQQQIIFYQQ